MVSISKRNKRTSLHQKYKVAKKVRQHHKKANKELKSKGRKKVKPVSIPMEVPFKDDILKGLEEAKLQENIMQKKRLVVLAKLKNKPKVNEFDALKSKLMKDPRKSCINDVTKLLETANIIIEVLDARDPNGTRSIELEKAVKLANKPMLFLLNKIDLVSTDNLNSWVKYLSKEVKVFPFKSSCQVDDNLFKAEMKFQKKSKLGNVYGANELMNYLMSLTNTDEATGKSLDKIVVGIVGMPNTGKSSVINSLKGKRVCTVSDSPMSTRELKKIDLNGKVTIMDSPCIVPSSSNDEISLAERYYIKAESILDARVKAEYIYNKCNAEHLRQHYVMNIFNDYESFLTMLAEKHNMRKKGGILKLDDAGRKLFRDWNEGRIAHWSKSPLNEKENDIKALSEAEIASINKIKSKYVGGTVDFCLVESSGPIKTVMDVDEIEDDDESCEEGSCCEEDCENDSCCGDESSNDDDVDMDE